MRIPDAIQLQLQCRTTQDLADIVVELEVSTGLKNPYFIRFPRTDAVGKAILTRDDFIGQFKDHWEQGLMDYQGGPDDAKPNVSARLFNVGRLRTHKHLSLT